MTTNNQTMNTEHHNAKQDESQNVVSMSLSQPAISLPLLYFDRKGTPLRVPSSSSSSSSSSTYVELPSELILQCMISYATLGDIAKYSTLQKQWCCLFNDVTNISYEMKWSVANSYLYGLNGLRRCPEKAMELYHELSSCNDNSSNEDNNNVVLHEFVVPAMKKLANLYLEGSRNIVEGNDNDDTDRDQYEIEQDTKAGLLWLERCFSLGNDAQSAYELALIYEYGRHEEPIDVVMAFDWFHKAAVGGDVDAMAELGLCYELGCGVEQNDQLALDWYMKAAELGHSNAKYSIGEAFEEARGVPQSDEEACLWYYKAAIDGCEDSKQALCRLQDIARIVVPGYVRNLSNV